MLKNLQNLVKINDSKDYDRTRDSLIFENFKLRDKEMKFADKRSFAFWGTNHIYKHKVKKDLKWIAAFIAEKRPDIKQNSTVMLYSDCRFIIPAFYIRPRFLRIFFKKLGDSYYIEKFRNNDNPFANLKAIKHLKKMSVGNVSLYETSALESEWNFVIDGKKELQTRDYLDRIILIRNSKHCLPISH